MRCRNALHNGEHTRLRLHHRGRFLRIRLHLTRASDTPARAGNFAWDNEEFE
jgi:hypothetical protein